MKTAQIDILSHTVKNGIYTVQYWDEASEGENNVEMQISEDALIDYINANDLNRIEFYDYSQRNLECDGLSERFIDPTDYLTENLTEVLQSYIQENS